MKQLLMRLNQLCQVQKWLCFTNSGFSDFSPNGVCEIHRIIFGDVYEWAGEYRNINIKKRESSLAGKSVWYSNWDCIDNDLNTAWDRINCVDWNNLSHKD